MHWGELRCTEQLELPVPGAGALTPAALATFEPVSEPMCLCLGSLSRADRNLYTLHISYCGNGLAL